MDRTLRYDHYKVLGVPRKAGADQIKRAYRERVMRCHPDRHPSPDAALVFHAVHEAYEVLSDPERRTLYDERLRFYRPVEASEAHATYAANWPRTATPRTTGSMEEDADRPVHRFAYVGLHVTGLLFGFSLILSLLTRISLDHMPVWTLVFALPGILAIPASIAGLRA